MLSFDNLELCIRIQIRADRDPHNTTLLEWPITDWTMLERRVLGSGNSYSKAWFFKADKTSRNIWPNVGHIVQSCPGTVIVLFVHSEREDIVLGGPDTLVVLLASFMCGLGREGGGGGGAKKYQLKPLEFLLGTNNRQDDVIVLGMLTQVGQPKGNLPSCVSEGWRIQCSNVGSGPQTDRSIHRPCLTDSTVPGTKIRGAGWSTWDMALLVSTLWAAYFYPLTYSMYSLHADDLRYVASGGSQRGGWAGPIPG
jgi:hypothetical protein